MIWSHWRVNSDTSSQTDAAALSANLDRRGGEPAGPLLGLFAAQEFFVQTAEGFGAIYDPPVALADLTSAAIKILAQNPNGFFLMVEESAIDRMAHRNNAPLTLKGVSSWTVPCKWPWHSPVVCPTR